MFVDSLHQRVVGSFAHEPPAKWLTIVAAPKESCDLVVVAEEGDKKLGAAVLKNEAQIAVAAKLEKLAAQLPDAETGVHVRLTEAV